MFVKIFLFIVFCSQGGAADSHARITYRDGDLASQRLASVLEKVLRDSFPELDQDSCEIRLGTFNNPEYFFDTSHLSHGKIFLNRCVYRLGFNQAIFVNQIPDEALAAILAHELCHLVDYQKMTSPKILALGIRMLADEKFRAKYERQTDLCAIHRGYGIGLIEHKKWFYPLLSGDALLRKKKLYLRPEEIADFLRTQ